MSYPTWLSRHMEPCQRTLVFRHWGSAYITARAECMFMSTCRQGQSAFCSSKWNNWTDRHEGELFDDWLRTWLFGNSLRRGVLSIRYRILSAFNTHHSSKCRARPNQNTLAAKSSRNQGPEAVDGFRPLPTRSGEGNTSRNGISWNQHDVGEISAPQGRNDPVVNPELHSRYSPQAARRQELYLSSLTSPPYLCSVRFHMAYPSFDQRHHQFASQYPQTPIQTVDWCVRLGGSSTGRRWLALRDIKWVSSGLRSIGLLS
ncbi:hypothetical protein F5Y17DRAFT_252185 [Xylariaceae sp. FL0594]|nr:hypothetical protein F5Y17DRAFT_252185 [Xylariaceae sp. FL0594]